MAWHTVRVGAPESSCQSAGCSGGESQGHAFHAAHCVGPPSWDSPIREGSYAGPRVCLALCRSHLITALSIRGPGLASAPFTVKATPLSDSLPRMPLMLGLRPLAGLLCSVLTPGLPDWWGCGQMWGAVFAVAAWEYARGAAGMRVVFWRGSSVMSMPCPASPTPSNHEHDGLTLDFCIKTKKSKNKWRL